MAAVDQQAPHARPYFHARDDPSDKPWIPGSTTTKGGLLVASFFFGATMVLAVFDCTKAGRQSWRSWRRNKRATGYVMMVWAVLVTGVIAAVCSFLFLYGVIPSPPSMGYLIGMRTSPGGVVVVDSCFPQRD
jgi:hypothetical protein